MLDRLHTLAARRADFAFETTLAARTYAPWLRTLQASGYRVSLFYVWLSVVELAVERVAIRVSQGGHSIPEKTIRQRYVRSVVNFENLYRPIVDDWAVYDNSTSGVYHLVAEGVRGEAPAIHDAEVWAHFSRGAR